MITRSWIRRVIFVYVIIAICSVFIGFVIFSSWRQPSIHYRDSALNGPPGNASSDDVINALQLNYLLLPPENRSDRNKSGLKELMDSETAAVIKLLLNYKRDGFFVESSARSQGKSVTLDLEMELGWTGLVIEADPFACAGFIAQDRYVIISPTCVSVKPFPMVETFVSPSVVPKDMSKDELRKGAGLSRMKVQCFPLYSYLLAVRRTSVDYLSLYLEGREQEALEHFPFDKVDVRTISIHLVPGEAAQEKLLSFMESRGFINWGSLTLKDDSSSSQLIFYKKFDE